MPTDANGVTVSNGYADNNGAYDVATKTIGGKRFQKMILYDGSGNEVTSWSVALSGTPSVNIAQVGGFAVRAGSAAQVNESFPIVFPSVANPVGQDQLYGNFHVVGGYFNPNDYQTYSFATSLGYGPGVECWQAGAWGAQILDGSGNNFASATTTPSASDRGLVVRNIPSGTQNVNGSIDITTAAFPTLDGATFDTYGKIVGTSLTGSYADLLVMGKDARVLTLMNSCDQAVIITLDGSKDHFELDAFESTTIDLGANGRLLLATTIQAKYSTTVPKTGSIRAWIVC